MTGRGVAAAPFVKRDDGRVRASIRVASQGKPNRHGLAKIILSSRDPFIDLTVFVGPKAQHLFEVGAEFEMLLAPRDAFATALAEQIG